MPYGVIKVDQVTFTNAGVDQTISVSGIVASISGNITATGTISGNVIRGGTVSGATVTGTAGRFGTVTGNTAGFTTVTGTTVTGTTASFTSGVFTSISGGTHTITSGVFASGTAAAPSITFTGDLDTGVYASAANQVAITTSGTERMRIDSTGKVGIGTSSPARCLDVTPSSANTVAARFGNIAERGLEISTFLTQSTSDAGVAFNARGAGNGAFAFQTDSTERLRIDSNGRVGIGTSSPGANHILEIEGGQKYLAVRTNAGAGGVANPSSSDGLFFTWNRSNGGGESNIVYGTGLGTSPGLTFGSWNGTTYTERARIDSSGRLGIGTASPAATLDIFGNQLFSASNPQIQFNAGGPIIRLPSANTLAFLTDSTTERMRLDSSGRVGIGTSSPTEALSVTGNIALTTSEQATITVGSSSQAGPHKVNVIGGGATDFGYYLNGTRRLFSATSDTNVTSVACNASSVITFINGTSEVARLDGSGRLGIGTSSPSSGLHLANATAGSAANFTLGNPANNWSIRTGTTDNSIAFIDNQFAAERLRIDSFGRVGIGTSSPGAALEIVGGSANNVNTPAVFIQNDRFLTFKNTTGAWAGAASATTSNNLLIAAVNNLTLATGANADERFRIDSLGRVGIGTSSPSALLHVAGDAQIQSLNGGPLAGFRNRIINGGMVVDQRNNGAPLSSGINTATYSVDRWYVYALGAAVTAQRVGSSAARYQSALRLTGAASNTFALIGQRIEVSNSLDLANQLSGGGGAVSISFAAATSASKTVTWKIFYANAADNFATKTIIAVGTQSTTSTLTTYSAQNIILPAVATTGLSIEFSVDDLTSGTFDLTGVQLEPGSAATPFERRSYGQELALCQRYFYRPNISYVHQGYGTGGSSTFTQIHFPVSMRDAPNITAGWSSGTNAIGSTISALSNYGANAQLNSSSTGDYAAIINWTSFNAEL